MNKNHFRVPIVSSLLFAVLGGIYDLMWPNPVLEKIIDFAAEVEPEIQGTKLILVGIIVLVALVLAVVSFIGLLIFKPWGRPVYVAGFIIVMPLYAFLGTTIYSGVSQLFYDLSMIASGAILALIYFSPVAEFYQKRSF